MSADSIDPVPSRALGLFEAELAGRLYFQPDNLVFGAVASTMIDADLAKPLAGGRVAFSAVRLLVRRGDDMAVYLVSLPKLQAWAEREGGAVVDHVTGWLERTTAPRADYAGLTLNRPFLMGVVNVTPDSFSDGGRYLEREAAVAQGQALLEAGADVLDIGGESTRPGADPVPVEQELQRVIPVVEALAGAGALVSVDTRRAAVMRAALSAGARVVNDVTALTGDPESLSAVANSDAAVVLMHMQGDPRTMQQAPRYHHAPADIYDYLGARIEACLAAGFDRTRIAIDPGIGFGKTVTHNLELLESLALFHGLGVPVLLGVSRKRFIGTLSAEEPADARVPGSIAAGLAGIERGVQILRVHDVAETRQALVIKDALTNPWRRRMAPQLVD